MKALILLCVFGVAFAVQKCPSNSHYEECGTACPLTCQTFNSPPQACMLVCVAGCFCDEGYVQSIDGKCVKPENCPALDAPECPTNSHYESCGTACPLTCENKDNPPEACVLMCNPGCHCDEGFVRSIDGHCVQPQNCPALDPPACGANSHYESCGTACPLTCENYNDPPKACVLMCNPGCHCDEGFVKSIDGHCVEPQNCPARDPHFCDENSHYFECGTACPLTCENYDNPPKICPAMCVSGCHCLEGFVKAKDGRCVEPENCPRESVIPECPTNSHYESCGTACPLTCENMHNPPEACVLMCNPGCHCDEGFVRSIDGHCVQPQNCPALDPPACGANSHYESCGTACPLTCENYDDPPKACVLMCNPGCHCDEGYVKAIDGACVKPEFCPARDPQFCEENSHYLECGTACPLTCENYDNPPKICPAMCVSGCHCLKGFVKAKDGRCVEPENCPSESVIPKNSVSACEQEKVVGPCKAYVLRFFFNKETGKCQLFMYGGCKGNDNNFATLEDCHSTCEA